MLGKFGNSKEARAWEWNELVGELEGDGWRGEWRTEKGWSRFHCETGETIKERHAPVYI